MLIHFTRSKLTTHTLLWKNIKNSRIQNLKIAKTQARICPKTLKLQKLKKILARNTGILLFLVRIINQRFKIYSKQWKPCQFLTKNTIKTQHFFCKKSRTFKKNLKDFGFKTQWARAWSCSKLDIKIAWRTRNEQFSSNWMKGTNVSKKNQTHNCEKKLPLLNNRLRADCLFNGLHCDHSQSILASIKCVQKYSHLT